MNSNHLLYFTVWTTGNYDYLVYDVLCVLIRRPNNGIQTGKSGTGRIQTRRVFLKNMQVQKSLAIPDKILGEIPQ